MRLPLVSLSIAFVLGVVVACSDSSETPSGDAGDAGTIDAGASRPVPTTNPPPKGDDDDDDVTDDDDDLTSPKDAGKDADPSPKDAGKDADPPRTTRYRVFVTKARFTGNLKVAGEGVDGLEGADNLCTKAAALASLGGGTTWKAWVSTTAKNAGERIVDRSPWYLVDKTTVVFQDFDGLSSPPLHKIDQNETGTVFLQGTGVLTNRVWTGTTNGGVLTPEKNCNDWSDDTQGKGVAGAYVEPPGSGTAASWTRYAMQPNESCSNAWPIYCFEQ